jgi:hypothetical protein
MSGISKSATLIFKCDQCERIFSVQSNLRRHIRTVHSDNRPFVCRLCGKTFNQHCNLKRHLKIHSAEELTLAGAELSNPTSSDSSPKRSGDLTTSAGAVMCTDEEESTGGLLTRSMRLHMGYESGVDAEELIENLNAFPTNADGIIAFSNGELDNILKGGFRSSLPLGEPMEEEEDEKSERKYIIQGNSLLTPPQTPQIAPPTIEEADQFVPQLPTVSHLTGVYGIYPSSPLPKTPEYSGGSSSRLIIGSGQFIGIHRDSNEIRGLQRVSNPDVLFNPVVRVSGEIVSGSGSSNNGLPKVMRNSDQIPLFNVGGRSSDAEAQVFNVSAHLKTSNDSFIVGSANYMDQFNQ